SSGDSVFIRPGTYTEDLTIPTGINVWAQEGSDITSSVIINGKLTFTGAVTSTFTNIRFTSNADNILDFTGTGSNQSTFFNCIFVYDTSSAIICDNTGASASFRRCNFQTTASVS